MTPGWFEWHYLIRRLRLAEFARQQRAIHEQQEAKGRSDRADGKFYPPAPNTWYDAYRKGWDVKPDNEGSDEDTNS